VIILREIEIKTNCFYDFPKYDSFTRRHASKSL